MMSYFNLLHYSQWITLPTQSCIDLNSFHGYLLYLFIWWWIVLSLSTHNLHLQFCYDLSIFTLTYLVFMALFCAAIWRDSVSLLTFPLLNHVQVFSCANSSVKSLEMSLAKKSCYVCSSLFLKVNKRVGTRYRKVFTIARIKGTFMQEVS